MLAVVERARNKLYAADIADRLEFLVPLVLVEHRQAVPRELEVGEASRAEHGGFLRESPIKAVVDRFESVLSCRLPVPCCVAV